MIKERIRHFLRSWREIPTSYPVETGLSFLFILCTMVNFEMETSVAERILHYAPNLFLLTFALNRWRSNGEPRRWKDLLYLLSALTFVPVGLSGAEVHWMSFSTSYSVTFFILLLLSIINTRPSGNSKFMEKVFRLVGSALSAIVLSGIAYLLIISIYQVVYSLFDLEGLVSRQFSDRIYSYAAGWVFGGLMTGLFLFFNGKEESFSAKGRVMVVLFRFILMPALLIYTVIFYSYIARILISWSLPQGGICYMATAFIFSSYLLKGMNLLQQHNDYGRYFRYISWINLPTLLLYWLSSFYRINEYGWTEMRVYLVVFGVIMSCLVLFFLRDRGHQFVQCSWVAIILLGLVTYIPGIGAKDIERISQASRGEVPIKEVKSENIHINLFEYKDVLDIKKYQSFQVLTPDHNNDNDDKIDFMQGDSIVVSLSKSELLQQQLKKNGIDEKSVIPQNVYPSLLHWETDSALLLFEHVALQIDPKETDYRLYFYGSAYYFKK